MAHRRRRRASGSGLGLGLKGQGLGIKYNVGLRDSGFRIKLLDLGEGI